MENINRFGRNLKGIILLICVVSLVMTTEVFCVENNSIENNDTNLKLAESKQIELLIREVSDLRKDLKDTKTEVNQKLDYQMQCNEQALNSVNTSISGATLALTIVGIIVVGVGILLGIYISFVERKVRNLTDENKSILETHLKIKDDVEKLDNNIKRNMAQLYDDLKKEETKVLVERLAKVPEDILNLFENLASREIPDELYSRIKEAYQKLKGTERSREAESQYLTLFFQHFPALVLFDKDLENEIEGSYRRLMASAFKNDIIQTSCEFLRACTDKGILNWREKIKKYFIALSKSTHKGLPELYREIYKALSTKENRFNFYSILKSEDKLKQISKIYGQHILADYGGASGNTESEEKVLKEIADGSEREGGAQE